MPFEEEDLRQILSELIEYSYKRIADKLGDIASVEGLVELSNDFEKRLSSYFKGILEKNKTESQNYCLNHLYEL